MLSAARSLSRGNASRMVGVTRHTKRTGAGKRLVNTGSPNDLTKTFAAKNKDLNPDPKMLLTTGSILYGRRVVREIAMVSGASVRAKNFLFDILSRISGFFGWEVAFYSNLLSETSSQAANRMVAEAASLGADAIINVKFTMSSTSDPTSGVFVYTMTYGTAVITEPNPEGYDPIASARPVQTRLSNMPQNPL